jgi:hypothetical protein
VAHVALASVKKTADRLRVLHEEKAALQAADRLPVVHVVLASSKEAVDRLRAPHEEKVPFKPLTGSSWCTLLLRPQKKPLTDSERSTRKSLV